MTAILLTAAGGGAQDLVFENLGPPLTPKAVPMRVVTVGRVGTTMAWGPVVAPDRYGVVGVDLDTGRSTWLDLADYGRYGIRMTRAANGFLYFHMGNPAHFFKYDHEAKTLIDLGCPASPGRYTIDDATGPDGVFWVGSYPATYLTSLDPRDDTIANHGRLAEDPREKYVASTAVSDDNVVYCALGMHHAEVWAYHPDTGAKRQILPDELTALNGYFHLRLCEDGRVYGFPSGYGGQRTEARFRCLPDGIEYVEELPPLREEPPLNRAGDYLVAELDAAGRLVLRHTETGEVRRVETDAEPIEVLIFTVACRRNGLIYGGGFQPPNLFSYDPRTGEAQDLGTQVAGGTQVRDILDHPRGLFMTSYLGAHIDLYVPETGERTYIGSLQRSHSQERIPQLALGPDGMIYAGTVPCKGHVTGALLRLDPDDLSLTVWPDLVPGHTPAWLCGVPQTGEVLVATSVLGNTSSVPTEDEACVFLWDVAEEGIAWVGHPLPGARAYSKLVMAPSGLIYGIEADVHEGAPSRYYAFDPARREVVFVGELPLLDARPAHLVDEPAGPGGLILGLVEDAIFAIDPSDHSARVLGRHPSIRAKFYDTLHGTVAEWATPEGVLYYGSQGDLWRVDVSGQ